MEKVKKNESCVSTTPEKKDDELLNLVKDGKSLSDEDQLKIFELLNAEEIILEYARQGKSLCEKAQLKIFDLPTAGKILFELV